MFPTTRHPHPDIYSRTDSRQLETTIKNSLHTRRFLYHTTTSSLWTMCLFLNNIYLFMNYVIIINNMYALRIIIVQHYHWHTSEIDISDKPAHTHTQESLASLQKQERRGDLYVLVIIQLSYSTTGLATWEREKEIKQGEVRQTGTRRQSGHQRNYSDLTVEQQQEE